MHADLNDRSSDRKGLASLLSKISEDTWFTNFNLLFFNFCHWQLRFFEAFVLGLWLGRNHLYWFVNDFSFTFQFSCFRYCFLIYDFVLEKHFWRRNVCWLGVSFFITFGLTCFQCHERKFFFRRCSQCVWSKINDLSISHDVVWKCVICAHKRANIEWATYLFFATFGCSNQYCQRWLGFKCNSSIFYPSFHDQIFSCVKKYHWHSWFQIEIFHPSIKKWFTSIFQILQTRKRNNKIVSSKFIFKI